MRRRWILVDCDIFQKNSIFFRKHQTNRNGFQSVVFCVFLKFQIILCEGINDSSIRVNGNTSTSARKRAVWVDYQSREWKPDATDFQLLAAQRKSLDCISEFRDLLDFRAQGWLRVIISVELDGIMSRNILWHQESVGIPQIITNPLKSKMLTKLDFSQLKRSLPKIWQRYA